MVLIDCLPKGQTINPEYCLSLLVQLKDILEEKRRGKFTKGVLFLHDSARVIGLLQPRRNWPTWASNLDLPPYSSVLAPSDNPGVKKNN